MTNRELSEALDAIERQTPEAVYAGRKGITVGHSRHGQGPIIFRRVQGCLVAEHWPHDWPSGGGLRSREILTPDLAERAARLMDR